MHVARLNRRELVGLLGSTAAWPAAAQVQQRERMLSVGMLLAAYTQADRAGQLQLETFRHGLRALGWTEARNVRLDHRWGDGRADHVKVLARCSAALAWPFTGRAQQKAMPLTILLWCTPVSLRGVAASLTSLKAPFVQPQSTDAKPW